VQGDASVLLQALNEQPSFLFLAVKERERASCLSISEEEGHLNVVTTLLEVGGRELVMLTENDGTRCLWIRAQLGHLDVVQVLLEGGGRELLMLTMDNGTSCLYVSAEKGNLDVVNALPEAEVARCRC